MTCEEATVMRAAMMRIRKVTTLNEALETAMFLSRIMSFFLFVFFSSVSLSSLSLILSNLREKERREKAK